MNAKTANAISFKGSEKCTTVCKSPEKVRTVMTKAANEPRKGRMFNCTFIILSLTADRCYYTTNIQLICL